MEDTLGNDTINMAEKCSFTFFLSNYSNGQIDWYGSEFESEINIYFFVHSNLRYSVKVIVAKCFPAAIDFGI